MTGYFLCLLLVDCAYFISIMHNATNILSVFNIKKILISNHIPLHNTISNRMYKYFIIIYDHPYVIWVLSISISTLNFQNHYIILLLFFWTVTATILSQPSLLSDIFRTLTSAIFYTDFTNEPTISPFLIGSTALSPG